MRIAILLLMTSFTLSAQSNKPLKGACAVIGHRGAPAYGGENTLWGFRKAIELGADGFELDLLPTKDGKLIVGHDFDLERLIGKDQIKAIFPSDNRHYVTEFTQEELQKLKVTFPPPDAEKYNYLELDASYRMPTLDEALELLVTERKKTQNPNLKIYIEIKTKEQYMHTISLNQISFLITKSLENHNLLGDPNVWIQSFDYEMMDVIAANPMLYENPKSQLGFDGLSGLRKFSKKRKVKKFLKNAVTDRGLQIFHMWKVPGKYIIDKKEVDFVDIAHELGIPIHLYTFRDQRYGTDYKFLIPLGVKGFESKEEELEYFMSLGVDAIMSDDVTSALEVRKRLVEN